VAGENVAAVTILSTGSRSSGLDHQHDVKRLLRTPSCLAVMPINVTILLIPGALVARERESACTGSDREAESAAPVPREHAEQRRRTSALNRLWLVL
jgi:hypothetical protein